MKRIIATVLAATALALVPTAAFASEGTTVQVHVEERHDHNENARERAQREYRERQEREYRERQEREWRERQAREWREQQAREWRERQAREWNEAHGIITPPWGYR